MTGQCSSSVVPASVAFNQCSLPLISSRGCWTTCEKGHWRTWAGEWLRTSGMSSGWSGLCERISYSKGFLSTWHHILTTTLQMQLQHSQCRAAVHQTSLPGRGVYHLAQIHWSPPHSSWVKCNTDGSVRGPSNLAACGGVARDSNGKWLFGFGRNLGSSNVIWAEL